MNRVASTTGLCWEFFVFRVKTPGHEAEIGLCRANWAFSTRSFFVLIYLAHQLFPTIRIYDAIAQLFKLLNTLHLVQELKVSPIGSHPKFRLLLISQLFFHSVRLCRLASFTIFKHHCSTCRCTCTMSIFSSWLSSTSVPYFRSINIHTLCRCTGSFNCESLHKCETIHHAI